MRILHLHAENVKKLKVVDIVPEANSVVLSGANEQGKTSALDAIQLALEGGDALKLTPEPIRKGETKAISLVALGDPAYDENGNEVDCKPSLQITRTWTANDKSYLKVENAEGAVFRSPQAILDKLVGDLTFDPLAFSNLKDKDQLETLLKLVEIPIDLDEWAKDRKAVYDERTALNRMVTDIEGQVKMYAVSEDTPDEEISAASVLAEQQAAQAVISANTDKRLELQALGHTIGALEADSQNLQNTIDRLKQELADTQLTQEQTNARLRDENREYDLLSDQCSQLVDPNLSSFQQRITEVDEINRRVRSKKQYERLLTDMAGKRAERDNLTVQLGRMDLQREGALKAAKMPLPDLSFTDQGVTYKSIPFRQCSSEERLRVSVAMGMALNPKLRVMFIRDASLLDTKHREVIKQMAVDNRYQLWLEVADDTGKVGLYFEDGEIVADKGAPVPKKVKAQPKKRPTASDTQSLEF